MTTAGLAAAAGALPLGAPPSAHVPDSLALAHFEAGLDGLAENDLVDEAEVDSIVRETVLHTIGDTPWADSKVGVVALAKGGCSASMQFVCWVLGCE